MPDQVNPSDPQSQGGGNAGDKTKLWAGKYKTPEEMEAAYKEAERGWHETRQEISQLKELVEGRYSQEGDYGRGQAQVNPAPVQPDPNQATAVLTRFYSDPIGVLQEVAQTTEQRVIDKLTKQSEKQKDLQGRIAAWQAQNPDLAKHTDLLDYHVRQTDARLAPERRLDEAAKKVRARIAELRGTPQSGEPDPGTYVEAPTGGGRESGGGPINADRTAVTQPTDPEGELKKYVYARNASARKPLGQANRK